MKEISKWIYSTLSADTTLQGYTGYTASDPRVYYFYPPSNITLNSTYPAYIIFFLLGSGSLPSDAVWALQRPDEVYQVGIYAKRLTDGTGKTTLENCFERIDALLHENLSSTITGWKVRRIYRSAQIDQYESQDHVYIKILEYTFHEILVSA